MYAIQYLHKYMVSFHILNPIFITELYMNIFYKEKKIIVVVCKVLDTAEKILHFYAITFLISEA